MRFIEKLNYSVNKITNWYFSRQAAPYWFVFLFDCSAIVFANLVVYILQHGATATAKTFWPLLGTIIVFLLPYLLGFRLLRTYAGVMRYSSFADLYRVGMANFIGIALVQTARLYLHIDRYFVTIRGRELLFAWFMATVIMFAARIIIKYMFDRVQEDKARRPLFIYGVKKGGMVLAKSIRMENPARFTLKGFISDSADMPGHMLMGVRVYPNDEHLIDNMKRHHIKALLVSPSKTERFANDPEFSNKVLNAGITIFTANLAQAWDGQSPINTSQLKEVQIEDLLPRDEIQINLQEMKQQLQDKRILISGSAGSIGCEIVEQVAQFQPKELILLDQAETPQHDLRLMLRRKYPTVDAHTIVCSITHEKEMEHIFTTYRPDYVFHAAAYKHVPMMEDNPSEAIINNVNGTRILADLSVKYGVKKFVMVSTDKAVNPTNVMGCSKRICEIYVQSLDKAIKDKKIEASTQFVTTRFGNVLGSNGSVIPLFKEQIKNGGPVTVTHPDIIRYFMLIPEACKLVLEAGTMGKGGEIFVFDMGQPVRIADLAKKMILLSGAKDVQIRYTGLREGEKLYEEVLNNAEITKPTHHPKIKIAKVREYDYAEVCQWIDNLVALSQTYDEMAVVRKMKEIVPEYKSNNSRFSQLDN